MIITTTKSFDKETSKLHRKIQDELIKKLAIFSVNPFDLSLYNHKLKGHLKKFRSIKINGDYRLIYEDLGNNSVRLLRIGTHSELYGK
jgi:addiction module RelE/StbE family toxin